MSTDLTALADAGVTDRHVVARAAIEPTPPPALSAVRRIVSSIRIGICRRLFAALGVFMARERFWSLIESSGIVIFVGPNGSGKSLAAVASVCGVLDGERWECREPSHRHHARYREHLDAGRPGLVDDEPAACGCTPLFKDRDAWCTDGCEAFAAGMTGTRLVYSTVPLLDDDGEHHPLYVRLEDYRQLLTIEHADVLFDEVSGVSDASDSAAIPVQVSLWMHTLRKADVRLRVTTPAYARCAKPIRQVAQVLVDARAFVAEPATPGRRWRPRMAMIFRAYDATEFVDYKPGSSRQIKSICSTTFWRPDSEAQHRYDTLGQVTPLGHVNEAGMCSACGGQRRRPACSCTAAADEFEGEMEIVEKVTDSGTRTRKALPIVDGEPSAGSASTVLASLPARREPPA